MEHCRNPAGRNLVRLLGDSVTDDDGWNAIYREGRRDARAVFIPAKVDVAFEKRIVA